MIHVGKTNHLTVSGEFPFGFQLSTGDPEDGLVTLPSHLAPAGLTTGAELEVFVTTDEAGSLVATPNMPRLQVGETRVLKAVNVTHFGAFFDWGLEKDLLVPNLYQEAAIDPGMHYVVHAFYEHKTNRVLGATRLHPFLNQTPPPFSEGQAVQCWVYAKTELGFKVVVEGTHTGLIFHSDAFVRLRIGDEVDAVIKHIREDGKLDIGLQRTDKQGRDSLADAIIDDLQAHGGLSTLTDKSPPDEIYKRFKVSKAAYKKALGSLYKQRKIVIDKQAVRLAPAAPKSKG